MEETEPQGIDVRQGSEKHRDRPVDFPSSVELSLSGDPDGLFNAANDLRQISTSEAVEVLYRLAIEQGVKEAYLNYGALLRDINRPMEALVPFQKAPDVGHP